MPRSPPPTSSDRRWPARYTPRDRPPYRDYDDYDLDRERDRRERERDEYDASYSGAGRSRAAGRPVVGSSSSSFGARIGGRERSPPLRRDRSWSRDRDREYDRDRERERLRDRERDFDRERDSPAGRKRSPSPSPRSVRSRYSPPPPADDRDPRSRYSRPPDRDRGGGRTAYDYPPPPPQGSARRLSSPRRASSGLQYSHAAPTTTTPHTTGTPTGATTVQGQTKSAQQDKEANTRVDDAEGLENGEYSEEEGMVTPPLLKKRKLEAADAQAQVKENEQKQGSTEVQTNSDIEMTSVNPVPATLPVVEEPRKPRLVLVSAPPSTTTTTTTASTTVLPKRVVDSPPHQSRTAVIVPPPPTPSTATAGSIQIEEPGAIKRQADVVQAQATQAETVKTSTLAEKEETKPEAVKSGESSASPTIQQPSTTAPATAARGRSRSPIKISLPSLSLGVKKAGNTPTAATGFPVETLRERETTGGVPDARGNTGPDAITMQAQGSEGGARLLPDAIPGKGSEENGMMIHGMLRGIRRGAPVVEAGQEGDLRAAGVGMERHMSGMDVRWSGREVEDGIRLLGPGRGRDRLSGDLRGWQDPHDQGRDRVPRSARACDPFLEVLGNVRPVGIARDRLPRVEVTHADDLSVEVTTFEITAFTGYTYRTIVFPTGIPGNLSERDGRLTASSSYAGGLTASVSGSTAGSATRGTYIPTGPSGGFGRGRGRGGPPIAPRAPRAERLGYAVAGVLPTGPSRPTGTSSLVQPVTLDSTPTAHNSTPGGSLQEGNTASMVAPPDPVRESPATTVRAELVDRPTSQDIPAIVAPTPVAVSTQSPVAENTAELMTDRESKIKIQLKRDSDGSIAAVSSMAPPERPTIKQNAALAAPPHKLSAPSPVAPVLPTSSPATPLVDGKSTASPMIGSSPVDAGAMTPGKAHIDRRADVRPAQHPPVSSTPIRRPSHIALPPPSNATPQSRSRASSSAVPPTPGVRTPHPQQPGQQSLLRHSTSYARPAPIWKDYSPPAELHIRDRPTVANVMDVLHAVLPNSLSMNEDYAARRGGGLADRDMTRVAGEWERQLAKLQHDRALVTHAFQSLASGLRIKKFEMGNALDEVWVAERKVDAAGMTMETAIFSPKRE
ncbi:hypothetical protein QFC21_005098 [Naganishia friedmannii]|uniref:Uncharacterized protein n=1 Tax=Naganishia friedmannii TaxID=89922 RepID=A0ACC2VE29_9TREE|nr:hypothetical protein QFC21_005098 [Naganishia friedmannii]